MRDIRLNKLAKLLINYSVAVKKGDFVFIKSNEVAKPWIKEVVREAVKAGAHVEVMLTSDEIEEIILNSSSGKQLRDRSFIMERMISEADVMLTAFGSRNIKLNSNISPQKLKNMSLGAKNWRNIFFKRIGNGTLRWCGIQFPTFADSQEADMSFEEYKELFYRAGLIDKDDPEAEWERVSEEQEKWVKYLDQKEELHIISEDTDIKIGIKGRKWINCNGKVNFPGGEIFTSPIENSIDGYISFSFPGIFYKHEIEEIKFEVKKGEIVKATAKKGEELLTTILRIDEGARYFGEVAIGTNYGIKRFTKNILFDEKFGGTIHMAIGASLPKTGGLNESAIHWDLLCDMRKSGKIYADGELFYERGKFLENII